MMEIKTMSITVMKMILIKLNFDDNFDKNDNDNIINDSENIK